MFTRDNNNSENFAYFSKQWTTAEGPKEQALKATPVMSYS